MTKQINSCYPLVKEVSATLFKPKNHSKFSIFDSFVLFWYKVPVNIQNLFEGKKKKRNLFNPK